MRAKGEKKVRSKTIINNKIHGIIQASSLIPFLHKLGVKKRVMGLGLSLLSSRKNCREMLSGGVELYALIKGIKTIPKVECNALLCDLLLFLLGRGLDGHADILLLGKGLDDHVDILPLVYIKNIALVIS